MFSNNKKGFKLFQNEIVLTSFLWILFLIQFSFDKRNPSISIADVVFTANYILASLLVNRLLVPVFFYQGKYWKFLILFFAVVFSAMLIEELVLEILFYSNTKGKIFNPYYAMIDIGATLAIFVGAKFGFDAWKRQLLINTLEKEKSASQLDHLKSQISPHFLFNNLNNLYSKALEGSEETPTLIHNLASLMRYMLYESNDTYVPIHKELSHVEDYIELQKLQIEDRGVVEFNVTKENTEHLKIAPLLLIGFIENCFKHSFSAIDDFTIQILIRIKEDKLHLHCSNPYSDAKELVNESLPKGIGLENVKKRLHLLYPDGHTLSIEKKNGFFLVDLYLTLK